MNEVGTAVGRSDKYVAGVKVGQRAVRWDGSGTAATELENLGTNAGGTTNSEAYAVNQAGTAVGYSEKWIAGSNVGDRALIWLPDASGIDLNDLGVVPTPAGGSWLLSTARGISTDGWVAGTGTFTPTVGDAYTRHWVAQVGLGGEWTDDFTGNLNGTWGRGPQWSTGTPAMQVGDATFSANASYAVALDRNEKTQSVTVAAGSVTLDLNGFSLDTMTGATVAGGATLTVVNSGAGGQVLGDVAIDGTLGGTAAFAGNLTFSDNSTLSPGASAGTIAIGGSLVLNSATVSAYELNGTITTPGGGVNDLVTIGGNLTLDGTLNVTSAGGNFATAPLGSEWRLFTYGGSLVNNGLAVGSMPTLMNPTWGFVVDTSAPGQVNLLISIVPEAPAWAFGLLAGSGLAACYARRRLIARPTV